MQTNMDEEQVRNIVSEEMGNFMYTMKYRFDRPTEFTKTVKLIDLPTSSTGLPTGALYNDSGTIKIV